MAVPLPQALASVPDPRSRHGRRFPLNAVLCLVALGILAGRQSLKAILEMQENYGEDLPLSLGFPRKRFPSERTLSRILAALDPATLEAALSAWVLPRLSPEQASVLAIDGKTLRGSRDGLVPGHHLVAAYAPGAEAVLAQLRVDSKTDEHKAALDLLGMLPLKGTIVTGDAAFCQRDLAGLVHEAGGDCVLTVKENQPGSGTDIGAGFGYEEAARSVAAAFSP